MLKSKNINLITGDNDQEYDNLQLTKYCEWHNCKEKGEYRAPTSRDKLRVFKFFCLKHIKEYNKAWDYFKGRTSDQIYKEVSDDAYWHRKTKKRIHKFKMEDKLNLFKDYEKQDNVKLNQFKSDSDKFDVSLKILGLKNFTSLNKLKKQYKYMVKKFHPDLNKSGSNEKIIELNEAYSALIKFLKK